MSDELECFKKAAELGCEFFRSANSEVLFKDIRGKHWLFLAPARTRGQTRRRFNSYAAAVCAEWWIALDICSLTNAQLSKQIDRDLMIDEARAFGRKYGAA